VANNNNMAAAAQRQLDNSNIWPIGIDPVHEYCYRKKIMEELFPHQQRCGRGYWQEPTASSEEDQMTTNEPPVSCTAWY
jgi:hypothetical protein